VGDVARALGCRFARLSFGKGSRLARLSFGKALVWQGHGSSSRGTYAGEDCAVARDAWVTLPPHYFNRNPTVAAVRIGVPAVAATHCVRAVVTLRWLPSSWNLLFGKGRVPYGEGRTVEFRFNDLKRRGQDFRRRSLPYLTCARGSLSGTRPFRAVTTGGQWQVPLTTARSCGRAGMRRCRTKP
jgi:hypothetical protein